MQVFHIHSTYLMTVNIQINEQTVKTTKTRRITHYNNRYIIITDLSLD